MRDVTCRSTDGNTQNRQRATSESPAFHVTAAPDSAPERHVPQDHAGIVARALLRDFYQHVAEYGGDRVGDLLTHTAGVLRDELKAAQQDMLNEIRLCDE